MCSSLGLDRRTCPRRRATLGPVKAVALIVGVVLALWVGALLAPSGFASYCGTVTGPRHHAFFLETKHLRCRSAKRVVQKWLNANARPSRGPSGWRCKHNYAQWYRCTHRTAFLKFNLHVYK